MTENIKSIRSQCLNICTVTASFDNTTGPNDQNVSVTKMSQQRK